MNRSFFLPIIFYMKIQENVPLKKYTTFRIGGPARYFFTANSRLALLEAVQWAIKRRLPLFILGKGSNLLVSDRGYRGLVINAKCQGISFKKNKIYAEAGASLGQLASFSLENGLSGAEWVAGIPGTVGGAIFGNAGAFGKSMKDITESVEVLDIKRNIIKKIKNKGCHFGYRQSFFKKNRHLIILSCELKLKKGDRHDIKKEMKGYLDYRATHHPKNPSAGSIFTNPKGYSARELIDICGLKGKKIGGAQISNIHSNFIINSGGARAQDVWALIQLVKKTVNKKFKIKLGEEIIFLK